MKKGTELTKTWLNVWPYILILTAGILIGLMVANWSAWTVYAKLVAAETALLAVHVLEEWYFPGGFHYMYNVLAGSDRPDRYPLNRLSDMWTNSVGIVFGCFCLLIGVTPMLAVMQLLLCLGECMAHISSGVLVRRRLRSQGKRTIYNPGLFTVLCGYLPLAVLWILSFVMERAPAFFEVAGAVACFVVLMAVTLFLPEKLCKRKDTPYGFTWGRGYYEKFRSDTPRTE